MNDTDLPKRSSGSCRRDTFSAVRYTPGPTTRPSCAG